MTSSIHESANQGRSLSKDEIEDAYAFWAPFYDRVFNAVFRPGRKAAAAAINRIGGNVLVVGVGTGLELPLFDSSIRLTGVDMSIPMLRIAQKRVEEAELQNVTGLLAMDALNLAFPDATFDAVVAPFVLTVVPDAHRMLDEAKRVVKPGGEIVLMNHVATEKGAIAAIERLMSHHADKLGWNPVFPWSVIATWIAAQVDIELLERKTFPPLSLFTLTRLRRK